MQIAVARHPLEDDPRVRFADMCEEHGDKARADFVKLQLSAARGIDIVTGATLDADHAEAYMMRAQTMLRQNRETWEHEIERGMGEASYALEFARGFPDRLLLQDVAGFDQMARMLRTDEACTINKVRLARANDQSAQTIATTPELARLTEIDLSGTRVTGAGLAAIANSTYASNLVTINCGDCHITDAGAQAVAASEHLQRSAKHSALQSAGYRQLARQFEPDAGQAEGFSRAGGSKRPTRPRPRASDVES